MERASTPPLLSSVSIQLVSFLSDRGPRRQWLPLPGPGSEVSIEGEHAAISTKSSLKKGLSPSVLPFSHRSQARIFLVPSPLRRCGACGGSCQISQIRSDIRSNDRDGSLPLPAQMGLTHFPIGQKTDPELLHIVRTCSIQLPNPGLMSKFL